MNAQPDRRETLTEQLKRRIAARPDTYAALALAGIGVLFFADVLFSSRNFYYRDILNFHYPLRKVLIASYARFELPVWNPLIYLGQPLLANPNYMAFYPTNLLHLFMPFNYAFKLHFIIHPLLGGIGMYFLQRRLGVAPLASFGGAFSYQFSGAVLSYLNLYNILPIVALMPWAGWACVAALTSRSWLPALGLGGLLGLQLIALEPASSLCLAGLLGGIVALFLARAHHKKPALWKAAKTFGVAAVAGSGLAAVQIVPTLELLPLSVRGAGFDFATAARWSVHPADLINVVVPNLFGTPFSVNRDRYWGELFHNGREPYIVSLFMGSSLLVLASLSFFSGRTLLRRMCLALLGVSVFLSLGGFNPAYHWLYEHVSWFRLGRYPSKYFLLAALALALLAALGLEFMLDRGERFASKRRRVLAVGVAGLIAGILCICGTAYLYGNPQLVTGFLQSRIDPALLQLKDLGTMRSQALSSARTLAAGLTAASGLVVLLCVRRKAAGLAPLLLAVLAAELVPSNLMLFPLISNADVDFVPEVNTFLSGKEPRVPYRVVPPTLLRPMPDLQMRLPNRSSAWLSLFYRRTGQPFYGIMNGVQYSIDASIDQLNTFESDLLFQSAQKLSESDGLRLMAKLNSPMVLSMGDWKHASLQPVASFDTMSEIPLRAYWLNNAIGRCYFVGSALPVQDYPTALQLFLRPDFPYGDLVLLQGKDIAAKNGNGRGSASVAAYGGRRVVCDVEAASQGYLVLLDSYYPGWRACVDGVDTPVLRANVAFRAVAVPAGKHRVEFTYSPTRVYAGLGITLATLLAAAGFVTTAIVRARRNA